MEKTERIAKLAGEVSRQFTTRERHNGEKYVCLAEGSPAWMTELCHEAHGSFMPDDIRYQFIREAVDAISESDGDEDEARNRVEEPDVYTSDLTAWLASHIERLGYCDEVLEEMGRASIRTAVLLACGQSRERSEVFSSVWTYLAERAEEEIEAEEEDSHGELRQLGEEEGSDNA